MDRNGGVSTDELYYYDFHSGHRNTVLDDAERDEDADGLTNFDETRGCMNRAATGTRCTAPSSRSIPLTYAATDLDDADSDGDGIRDGADDQDHDDIPNIMECNRVLAASVDDNADGVLDEDALAATTPRGPVAGRAKLPASGFINAFNPCLPHVESRTCARIVIGPPWAPFAPADKYYMIRD